MEVTTPISGTGGTVGAAADLVPDRGLAAMKPEDFFKILIMQLQMQDPMEPMKNDEMIAQISQIRDMEMSMTLTESLRALSGEQRFAAAAGLIGKHVTGAVKDEQGNESEISGVVTGVRFTEKGGAILELEDGNAFPLAKLVSVTEQAPDTGDTTGDAPEDESGEETSTETAKQSVGTARRPGAFVLDYAGL